MAALLLAGCYEGDPSDFREAVVADREGVTALAISGELPVIEVGASLQLSAVATVPAGSKDLSAWASWRSSNPAAVIVDARGRATAVGNGTATITAELAQYTDSVTLAASDAALQTVTVSGSASVDECATATFTASGHYDDGTDRDISSLVTWAVDNATVARMSTRTAEPGMLVSRLAGPVGVTATRGGVTSLPFAVTVADNLVSLAVTPDAPGEIARNGNLQFTATGTWGTTTAPLTRAATWQLVNDDTGAAAIGNVGNGDTNAGLLVAGDTGGTGTLSASCGGLTDAVDVSVVHLDTLAITNTRPVELDTGASVLLVLEGTWSDGTSEPLNEDATWSVSIVSGTPVTVSNTAGTRGRVTAGSSEGVSTVTATVEGKSVSVTVSVVE